MSLLWRKAVGMPRSRIKNGNACLNAAMLDALREAARAWSTSMLAARVCAAGEAVPNSSARENLFPSLLAHNTPSAKPMTVDVPEIPGVA